MLEKLAANDQINRRFMFLKRIDTRRLSAPAPGYIHDHYFQTSLKRLRVKAKFYVEPLWEGGTKII